MTDNADLIATVREVHPRVSTLGQHDSCSTCRNIWPCATIRVCDALEAVPLGRPVTPADAMRLTEEIAAIVPALYLEKQDDAWYIAEVIADWLIDTGNAVPRTVTPTREQIAETIDQHIDMPLSSRLVIANAVLALFQSPTDEGGEHDA